MVVVVKRPVQGPACITLLSRTAKSGSQGCLDISFRSSLRRPDVAFRRDRHIKHHTRIFLCVLIATFKCVSMVALLDGCWLTPLSTEYCRVSLGLDCLISKPCNI